MAIQIILDIEWNRLIIRLFILFFVALLGTVHLAKLVG